VNSQTVAEPTISQAFFGYETGNRNLKNPTFRTVNFGSHKANSFHPLAAFVISNYLSPGRL
jgi:hypothetical protein